MERIDKVIMHPVYQEQGKYIEEAERDRIFCKHGLAHALDVARILYIMVLERNLPFGKEILYAAALLHDIGRAKQYSSRMSHHEAGASMAKQILADCGFEEWEILLVTNAIMEHQAAGTEADDSLNVLLYQADKLSRNCFCCKAWRECYWEKDKKNENIQY